MSGIASTVSGTVSSTVGAGVGSGGGAAQNFAVRFDGTTDYATIPEVTHTAAAGTLMVRCKLDVASPADFAQSGLVEWTSVSSFHYPFTNGAGYCAIFRNTRVDAFTMSAIPRDGWHWVIVRDDAANGWEFLQSLDDGVLESCATAAHEAWDTSPVNRYIGANYLVNFFDGLIDRVLIGDSRWTDEQIQAVIAGGNGTDALVRYECNSLAGDLFADDSGNGHDAPITAGAPTLEAL